MIEYIPMQRQHIDGLVEVEEQCFNSGFARKTFEKELENKIAAYFVATDGEKVIGYAGLWNMCGIADIMDVAVHKDFRRQGIGEALIEKLIEYCKNEDISEINLEVRISNDAAQSLYKKMGFIEVGQRPNYYENRETAILMTKILTEEK
ncbi:MAG: ribosomal-protein-alanine N-acetyltransferase [Ruminococcaceae bacterium]|nr:ribosomal-protein-alanine N-acetyltransferase [Oscillospiraceae bacterium]